MTDRYHSIGAAIGLDQAEQLSRIAGMESYATVRDRTAEAFDFIGAMDSVAAKKED